MKENIIDEEDIDVDMASPDEKRLWANSHGICNFPGCGRYCFYEEDNDDFAVIGHEAHIIPAKDGGQKTYENLILLCCIHHKVVDAHRDKYTIETLKNMKEKHFQSVETQSLTKVQEENIEKVIELNTIEEKRKVKNFYRPLYEYLKNTFINQLMVYWKNPGRKYRSVVGLSGIIQRYRDDLADYNNTKKDYGVLDLVIQMSIACNNDITEVLNRDEGPILPDGIEIQLETNYIMPIREMIYDIIKRSET